MSCEHKLLIVGTCISRCAIVQISKQALCRPGCPTAMPGLRQGSHHGSDGFVFLSPGRVELRAGRQQRDERGIQLVVFHRTVEQLLKHLGRKHKI